MHTVGTKDMKLALLKYLVYTMTRGIVGEKDKNENSFI